MVIDLLILLLLLLVNAFFALAEMAIVSFSRPLLKQMAKQGDWKAQKAIDLADDPGRFLSTMQVGLTLIGVMSGAYGGATLSEPFTAYLQQYPMLVDHAQTISVACVVTLITFATVVFGELIPKQIALTNPQAIARLVAPPVLVLTFMFSPVAILLQKSGAVLLRAFGVKPKDMESMTEDEVKAVIFEGKESGALDDAEHSMLQRIIRLGDREVKSIMTHRMDVVYIDIHDPLDEIKRIVHETGHARYPVTDGDIDDIIGIIHSKDLLDGVLSQPHLDIRSYVRDFPSLPENTSCAKALELFKNSRAHMAAVIDEYGAFQGVVTDADILEAIIGVLPSNYDNDEDAQIIQREDGSWLVDGLTPIHEIHLMIGIEQIKTSENYDTIAGFLLEEFGRPPAAGEYVEAHGYRFEIMDMDGRRIDKILIATLSAVDDA